MEFLNLFELFYEYALFFFICVHAQGRSQAKCYTYLQGTIMMIEMERRLHASKQF